MFDIDLYSAATKNLIAEQRLMLTRWTSLVFLALAVGPVQGQDPRFDAKLLDAFPARSIGPANMGGRIVDLAVVETNPATMYVAAASGGLWKTVNSGESWTPVFDRQSTQCLGAVALAQSQPDVIWVGTGEANAR